MLTLSQLALRSADPLLSLSRHVPFILQRWVLEAAVARLFAEPLQGGAFDLLQGRWLRLEVSDLRLAWCITRDRQGLRMATRAPVDVCIRGNWREFVLLASRQEDPDTLFFRRRLVIEGDTELGLAMKNLIDSLDPDHLPPRLWRSLCRVGEVLREDLAQRRSTAAGSAG
ncbi:SCP2 domain-containing protein [Pseudomonas cavernicola]|uniref:Ubiquinone biosynthesis accessory factor UbiT n=1 Tax=Pseudomonas cavernicola TaxID=2320866 RepID=A0A418X8V1_9PSED|nr:SCP2 sterol-binding domain-containing protein [Pseudomonas cavernicola]RJG08900.1 SCP2 domain-containing protein [Pseudomonas cavernicola]